MSHFPHNISSNSDECHSIPGDVDYLSYEQMEPYSCHNDAQNPDLIQLMHEEQSHWSSLCNSPKDQEKSPYSPQSPYHHYQPIQYNYPPTGHIDETYYTTTATTCLIGNLTRRPPVKKRNSANKKERKRTQSINSAFSSLREKIPNVPCDTKVSKIKTLKLAIGYISFLQNKLDGHEDAATEFKPELVSSTRKMNAEKRNYAKSGGKIIIAATNDTYDSRRNKGRTGWPQHVWAGTLNNNNKLI